MTERERLAVTEIKIRKCQEQHYKCGVCGKPITPPSCQLAHKIPKTKFLLNKYGKQLIHHDLNLVACCSLNCNSLVLCDPKTRPVEAKALIDKIKESL